MPNSVHHYQTSQLDNLEVLYVPEGQRGFPQHFHPTYCLSLVLRGAEQTELADRSLLALPGSLSVTHPDEVHTNPLPEHCSQSFVTLYISEDVMQRANGGARAWFGQPIIQDTPLFAKFERLVRASLPGPTLRSLRVDEPRFFSLLQRLVQHATSGNPADLLRKSWFTSLDALIDERLHRKLSLDEMAQQMGLSKFKFARLFKEARGISPAHYLVVKRIERAKTMLRQGIPLADTALQVGFYDQAHFSRAFQGIAGVTPGQYLSSCKILQ